MYITKLSEITWLVKILLYRYKNSFTGFNRYLPVQMEHISS